jgi:hypothetical protein
MSLTSTILAAAETHGAGTTINPYAVGGIAFGILLVLLVGTLMFGRGREHS